MRNEVCHRKELKVKSYTAADTTYEMVDHVRHVSVQWMHALVELFHGHIHQFHE